MPFRCLKSSGGDGGGEDGGVDGDVPCAAATVQWEWFILILSIVPVSRCKCAFWMVGAVVVVLFFVLRKKNNQKQTKTQGASPLFPFSRPSTTQGRFGWPSPAVHCSLLAFGIRTPTCCLLLAACCLLGHLLLACTLLHLHIHLLKHLLLACTLQGRTYT